MKRTFIYTDDKSDKFWTIEINGSNYTVNYGKTGTTGQTQSKDFADEAACQKAAEKLIAEKTKKGYVEQGGNNETAAPKQTATEINIPEYEEHEEAELDENKFVVDIENPLTIASAFKYQLEHFDEFIENLQNMPKEEALTYGEIEDDEFTLLLEKYDDEKYDEEILTKALASSPELFPFLEQYAKEVIIEASKRFQVWGPWTSEFTIMGEYLIPMLAEADNKYFYLLEEYIKTNIEVRLDEDFHEQQHEKAAKIAKKWNMKIGELDNPEDKIPKSYKVTIDIPKYEAPDDIEECLFVVDLDNPLSIASVIQHHLNDFTEYVSIISGNIEYGCIKDGKFERIEAGKKYANHMKHDISERIFYTAAVSYPELRPLVANFLLRVIDESEGASSGPWACQEFLLGEFAMEELIDADISYLPLLTNYMRTHVEVRFSNVFKEQFTRTHSEALGRWEESMKKAEPKQSTTKGSTTKGKPKKFTAADFKEAAEILESLDEEKIAELIAAGAPLNGDKYPLYRSKWTALQCLIFGTLNNDPQDKIFCEKFDRLIMLLVEAGAKLDTDNFETIETAFKFNCTQTINYVKSKGFDINTAINYQGSLMLCANVFYPSMFDILLDNGANPLIINDILHRALVYLPNSIIRRLVEEFKVPLNTLDENGYTPFESIDTYCKNYIDKWIEQSRIDVQDPVKRLEESGDGTPLYKTIEKQEETLKVREYMREVSKNMPPVVSAPANADEQAELDRQLIEACKESEIKPISVKRLIDAGANPQAKDENGLTPMHHVAKQQYPHLITEALNLMRKNIDPKAVDNFGRTPLFYFCTGQRGNTEVVRDLINLGIDPTHKDNDGFNALAYLISITDPEDTYDSEETIQSFIQTGIPPTDINVDGDTLFHRMGDLGDYEVENILNICIKLGVDINAKNKNGDTALHLAVKDPEERGYLSSYLARLLEHNPNINIQDSEGNTAIHLSAYPQSDYKPLLEAGPDLNIKNNAGQTVLDCIKASGLYDDKEEIKSLVDSLISNPAAERKALEFSWTPHRIDENAPLPVKLDIKSSRLISGNDGDYDMLYLGKNRIGIFGEIPGVFTAINTETGEVAWELNQCTSSSDDLPIAADGVTYIPRQVSSFSITACDSETGKILWDCKLSTSYSQFGTYFTLSDENIYHASIESKKIYVVNRKTGKLTARIALKNPLRRYAFYDILPWGDKILAIGTKKNGGNTVDLYDTETKAYVKTIVDLGEQSAIAQVVYNNYLYLMTTTALLHKIDLNTGEILCTTKHGDKEYQLYGDYSDGHMVLASDNKIRYFLRSGCDELSVFNTYNPETDKIESSYNAGPMTLKETIMTYSNKLVYLGGDDRSREIKIYDAEKGEVISEIELPIFGKYDNVSHILVAGDAVYALQDGGNQHGKDNCVLYRLQ